MSSLNLMPEEERRQELEDGLGRVTWYVKPFLLLEQYIGRVTWYVKPAFLEQYLGRVTWYVKPLFGTISW